MLSARPCLVSTLLAYLIISLISLSFLAAQELNKQNSDTIRANGCYERDVPGDNTCMYGAVSDQLADDHGDGAHVVKRRLADFALKNRELVQGVLAPLRMSVDEFAARVHNPRIQGGYAELSILPFLFERTIFVVQGGMETQWFDPPGGRTRYHIALSRHISADDDCNHYMSVRRAPQDSMSLDVSGEEEACYDNVDADYNDEEADGKSIIVYHR